MKSVSLIFALILGHVHSAPRVDPLVETRVGLIRGLRATDGEYSSFTGIPYARVDPSHAFGPALPYPNFEEVFDAYADTTICPQSPGIGTLDCLQLNVYVPDEASTSNRLPVLIFIHGGAFTTGFASRYAYGPKFLVKQGIVLVTLNYRVGPYGFMCLDDAQVPGNEGLRDQVAALRWIKENIEAFGGDANKITVSGESAGAASVDFHFLYGNGDLFDQVILQSGHANVPWAVRAPDYAAHFKLATHLGYDTDSTEAALEFLSNSDPIAVVNAVAFLGLDFTGCVEKQFDGVDGFITDHPANMVARYAEGTPILTGSNDNELIFIFAHVDLAWIPDIFREQLVLAFDVDDPEDVENVRQFYIGDRAITNDVKQTVTDFASDLNYHHPIDRSIDKYFEGGAEDIYRYMFEYDGGRNYLKDVYNVTYPGASHADELGYLFDMSYYTEEPSPEDQFIIDSMTSMWANFVKYGNPTPPETTTVQWPKVSRVKMPYMTINSDLRVQNRLYHDRLAFWDLFHVKLALDES